MPIHHSDIIDTIEKQEMVLSYCRNDVKFTKKIMEYSKSQISLRGALTKEYGINLYSASEPRISKELFKYFLSKADRKSTRLNSSHVALSRMPSSA